MIISEDEVMRDIENILYSCLGMKYNVVTRNIVYSEIQAYLHTVINPPTILIAEGYRVDDFNNVIARCGDVEWISAICSSYREAEEYIRNSVYRLDVKISPSLGYIDKGW